MSLPADLAFLVRVCGGATYHEVFTFKDRLLPFADTLRERLTRASIHPTWNAAGFEIAAADGQIVIVHADHPGWFVRVGQRDVYFQHDEPGAATIVPLASVAGFVIDTVVDLLRMPSPRTVGAKFDVAISSSRWNEIAAALALSTFRADDEEDPPSRVQYSVGPWEASVTVVETNTPALSLCDLDFFCRDSYLIPGEYVMFFHTAWGHLVEDLLPFLTSTEFGRRPDLR